MRWTQDYVARAAAERRIVAGFNVFGHEDAQAVIRAAERVGAPVLLMVCLLYTSSGGQPWIADGGWTDLRQKRNNWYAAAILRYGQDSRGYRCKTL